MGVRPWEGIQVPEELKNGGVTPPFVQWVNSGASLDPRRPRGGWFMPDRWDVIVPGERAMLVTASGHVEAGVYTEALAFAPVAQRFHWVNALGEILPGYQDGARGWLQVLALLPGDSGRVVFWGVITVKGIASRDLGRIIREHQKAAAEVRGQGWMFWVRVRAGDQLMVGERKRSLVTAIEPAREFQPERDFIGQGLVEAVMAQADFVRRWREGEVVEWPEPIALTDEAVQERPAPEVVPPASGVEDEEDLSLLEAMRMSVKTRRYGEVTLQDLAYRHRDLEVLEWLAQNSQNDRLRRAARRVLRHLSVTNGRT